jgi:uncharacterized repeat protein (TIGR03803 family)
MERQKGLDIIPRLARDIIVSIGLAVPFTAQAWAAPDFLAIYEFPGGAHGINPEAGVILGPAGSVFGTTDSDGINAGGVVFQLSPPQGAGRAWTQRILKRFRDPAEGGYPLGLTWTSTGVLYGVTLDGGGSSSGSGTVFRLAPLTPEYTNWTFATLHRFRGGDDGARPSGSLIDEHAGALSGTTILGGAGPGMDGYGIAFSLTASETSPGRWTETILHRFTSSPDGATPGGTLLSRGASVRVGVTTTGGTGICSNVGCGTVYRLVQTTDGWIESAIYQFKGGADGSIPVDRLIADANGSLYGATAEGGLSGPDGHFFTGTVFRLDPPSAAAAHWTKTILYEFQGAEDGYLPEGGVTLDEHGTLYGTTEFGGAHFGGTVFKLTANAPGQPWTKTILHDFGGGPGDGTDPTGHVTLDASGTIFGTTLWGGTANYGTVYRITQ